MLLIAKVTLNRLSSGLISFLFFSFLFFSIYYDTMISWVCKFINFFPFTSLFLSFLILISVKSCLSLLACIKAHLFFFSLDLHFVHFEWFEIQIWSQILSHEGEKRKRRTEAIDANWKGERKKKENQKEGGEKRDGRWSDAASN